MSMLDGLLAQFGGLDAIAAKIGIAPEQITALTESVTSKVQAGDNPLQALSAAAGEHGLSLESLQGLMGQLGGESSLSGILAQLQQGGAGSILGALDKDGDGNPLDDLGGLAKGLFS